MKDKQQDKHQDKLPGVSATKASRRRWVTGIGALVVAAAATFLLWPGVNDAPPAQPSAPAPAAQSTRSGTVGGQERLVGRWLRSDGGYFIEIRGAAVDGKLDAGYYNPKSIRVGRAEWKMQNGKVVVFVELRDVNYPGSTYTLELLDAEDRLVGTYFQAVEQATFDVAFVRQQQ